VWNRHAEICTADHACEANYVEAQGLEVHENASAWCCISLLLYLVMYLETSIDVDAFDVQISKASLSTCVSFRGSAARLYFDGDHARVRKHG
jgi:hypothetical protein